MRREFMLIFIGILCISTISTMLSNYAKQEPEKIVLDTVVGMVGAGNFSYWQLGHTGPLLIELTSLSGDADLYVSDTVRPSYEIERNNFSSATCGKDLISIPVDFPRPIGIGVFGHSSHSISEYCIKVFLDDTKVKVLSIEFYRASAERHDNKQRKEKPLPKKTEEEKPRFFLKLLNVLEMIFEMVVL